VYYSSVPHLNDFFVFSNVFHTTVFRREGKIIIIISNLNELEKNVLVFINILCHSCGNRNNKSTSTFLQYVFNGYNNTKIRNEPKTTQNQPKRAKVAKLPKTSQIISAKPPKTSLIIAKPLKTSQILDNRLSWICSQKLNVIQIQ